MVVDEIGVNSDAKQSPVAYSRSVVGYIQQDPRLRSLSRKHNLDDTSLFSDEDTPIWSVGNVHWALQPSGNCASFQVRRNPRCGSLRLNWEGERCRQANDR